MLLKKRLMVFGMDDKYLNDRHFDLDKDERFIPKKSIEAGAFIFASKRKAIHKLIFRHFKIPLPESEKQKFYVAAYNAGQGTVLKAWKNFGRKDCTWDQLISGDESSALWQAIPKSWIRDSKYKEITQYVSKILKRVAT